MINELVSIFKNDEFGNVRVVLVGDKQEPYFVGKDVAECLGYDQTSNMVKRLDSEDVISSKMDGMNMKSILINEFGLYSAILGSQLESAKKFKRWVISEVLPTIRKHGVYVTDEAYQEYLNDKPKFEARLADAHEEILSLRNELKELDEINEQLTENYNDIKLMHANCTNEVMDYVIKNVRYKKNGKVSATNLYNHYCRWCSNVSHYMQYTRKEFEELLQGCIVDRHPILKHNADYVNIATV